MVFSHPGAVFRAEAAAAAQHQHQWHGVCVARDTFWRPAAARGAAALARAAALEIGFYWFQKLR